MKIDYELSCKGIRLFHLKNNIHCFGLQGGWKENFKNQWQD